MIHFPVLRTRRLTVQLRELPIGEAIALTMIPAGQHEVATTRFLSAVVQSVSGVTDPRHWTVQERITAVMWYLAATVEGGPDFPVGERGRFSDYFDGQADCEIGPDPVELGRLEGDDWSIRHLTGGMVESVERTFGEIPGVSVQVHWLFGCMAAQLVMAGETPPDPAQGEAAFDQFLLDRMRVLLGYPQTVFTDLHEIYHSGRDRLHHLVHIGTQDTIVVMPKGGAANSDLLPATFSVRPTVSSLAQAMGRWADGSG